MYRFIPFVVENPEQEGVLFLNCVSVSDFTEKLPHKLSARLNANTANEQDCLSLISLQICYWVQWN